MDEWPDDLPNEREYLILAHFQEHLDKWRRSIKEVIDRDEVSEPTHPQNLEYLHVLGWLFTLEKLIKGIAKGKLSVSNAEGLRGAFNRLSSIVQLALAKDEYSISQYWAIERLLMAKTFDLSKAYLDKVSEADEADLSLARGWEMRRLMGDLSFVVMPALPNQKSVLEGPVRLNPQMAHMPLSINASRQAGWTADTTLQSLSVDLYQTQMWERGYSEIDTSTLWKDLKKVKKWEETLTEEERRNTEQVMINGVEQNEWPYFRRYRLGKVVKRTDVKRKRKLKKGPLAK